tara:strand:- start:51 stop:668 length:618 start_codon:yes stop_codon:yes gene_type:complete
MNNIVIVGGGGHARSCIETINSTKIFKIIGIVDEAYEKDTFLYTYKILGKDKDLEKIKESCDYACIGVGHIKEANVRKKLFENLKEVGYKIPKIISSNSKISNSAEIGEGTIIMSGVQINSGVKIGKNCIINTGAILEHDVEIDDNCHISTGVIINGSSSIGHSSFLGSGTIVRNNIKIGRDSLIGMGSIILSDLQDESFFKRKN